MKEGRVKIRIIGSSKDCEKVTAWLKQLAKPWGSGRIFEVRKIPRDPEHNKYSSTFGTADMVHYVKLKIAKSWEEKQKEKQEKADQEFIKDLENTLGL